MAVCLGRGGAAADHRRRRLGQDGDAGASGGVADRGGRRSAPHHAADVLAAGGGGNDAAGRADPAGLARQRRSARWPRRWPGPARSTPSARGCCANTPKRSGLRPAFTIHDREDSADLMNLVRHDLGFSQTEKRFPAKGTCLAIYSRAVNSELPLEEVLGSNFPWCAEVARRAADAVRALCRDQAAPARARLRRPSALLGAHDAGARDRRRGLGAVRSSCWSTNIRTPTSCRPRCCWRCGRSGKGLTVVGDDAQSIYSFRAATVRNILDFPGHFRPRAEIVTLEQNYRSTQPILDGGQRGDRTGRGALHQEFVVGAQVRRAAAAGQRARRGRSGALRGGERCWKAASRGSRSRRRRCCSAPRITPGRSKWN